MATKKTPPPQFIAINENDESILTIGTLDDVKQAIQDYCEFEDCDGDDLDSEVTVYELGKKVSFSAERKIEIHF